LSFPFFDVVREVSVRRSGGYRHLYEETVAEDLESDTKRVRLIPTQHHGRTTQTLTVTGVDARRLLATGDYVVAPCKSTKRKVRQEAATTATAETQNNKTIAQGKKAFESAGCQAALGNNVHNKIHRIIINTSLGVRGP
jgi:hypothetical protein